MKRGTSAKKKSKDANSRMGHAVHSFLVLVLRVCAEKLIINNTDLFSFLQCTLLSQKMHSSKKLVLTTMDLRGSQRIGYRH
jgi:hypothetical protein